MLTTRYLSIQSWVCHGYVGNKCAVFGLQSLGIEVDPINTVQFSNHTGYPTWKGERLQGEQLYALFEGLKLNNLAKYSHLLTGYIGTPSSLRTILKILEELKELNPKIEYACDPVLGDDGKLYVTQDLLQIYRTDVLSKAKYLFPNQTECEFLTEMKIQSQKEALDAINVLHSKGIETVIVTSLFYGPKDIILVIGSTKKQDSGLSKFIFQIQKFHRSFTGTGDLFASLFMGWISKGLSVSTACENAINSLHAVAKRTLENNSEELLLIQSKMDIENPTIKFKAEILED